MHFARGRRATEGLLLDLSAVRAAYQSVLSGQSRGPEGLTFRFALAPARRSNGPRPARVRRIHGIVHWAAAALLLVGACRTAEPESIRQSPRTGERSVRPGINDPYAGDVDVEQWLGRFEVESREIARHRDDILEAVSPQLGMEVADIGAGTGLFTIPFAQRVGPDGRVYAVDLVPKFLEHIRQRATNAGSANVEFVQCTEDSVGLPRESIDLAFICDTYHHFEFPRSTMTSVREALRSGGRVVIVDFERIEGHSRPWVLEHVRAPKETVIQEMQSLGFELMDNGRAVDFLEENYLVQFRKPR